MLSYPKRASAGKVSGQSGPNCRNFRGVRGGSRLFSDFLRASFWGFDFRTLEFNGVGFRVASIPEPSTILLLRFGSLAVLSEVDPKNWTA